MSRVPVVSTMWPANQGPISPPKYPMESIIPLAIPIDSFGIISTGSASIIGNVPPVEIPTIAIKSQPNDKGTYIALNDAKANTRVEPQMNGFLKPTLKETHGIKKMVGRLTQPLTDAISAAKSGGAPFMIISAGLHPDHV